MKKLFLLALIGLFFSGCGAGIQRSEFLKHDTMYKNWDHLIYSWWGHRNPTDETQKKSQEQGWWGIPTPDK